MIDMIGWDFSFAEREPAARYHLARTRPRPAPAGGAAGDHSVVGAAVRAVLSYGGGLDSFAIARTASGSSGSSAMS